jgi:hypothetical protein
MALNLEIRGLSDRGFRVGTQLVKRGTTVTVDVDDPKVAASLIRHDDQWVRASGQSVQLRGLGSNDRFRSFKTQSSGTRASATLTSTGVAPANNETVTLGTRTYTFKTTLTGAANEVLIGASAAIALDNLKAAVNKAPGGGTTYSAATAQHEQVEATTNTDTTQLFVSRVAGTAGNALASTETSTVLSFGGGTFAGGLANSAPVGAKPGTSVEVNVDDQQNARALRRNKSRYIVGSSNLISVRGLSDRGIRIKDSGGVLRVLKRGAASRTVNVDDRNVARMLSRNSSEWIEA